MLLKNSDGNKSASFTMMIVAFVVVMLWLLLSIVVKIGPVTIREFSGAEAMMVLSPLLLLYFGRRGQMAAGTTPEVPEAPETK